MIRLLGAITGSALALATLLVLVGVPQFKTAPNDVQRNVVTLPFKTETVVDTASDNEVTAEQAAPKETGDTETVVTAVTDTGNTADDPPQNKLPEPALVDQQAIDDTPEFIEAATPAVDTSSIDAQQWYAFWSPFRSEIAASGFIGQLQRVTGLDYRVVKLKPGMYEVAFGYLDDTEIPLNLSQISAATGLELPEG